MADNITKFPGSGTPENETDAAAPEKSNITKFPAAEDENGKPLAPEDVFPDLHNEELIKAMEALKVEENKETQTALIEKVLAARFFAPVDVIDKDGKVLEGNGRIAIPKEAKFNFKLIQNMKGEQYFTVFTDIDEFRKWSKGPRVNTIVVVFPQIAQLAVQKADIIKGFVINPMSQNIIFSQDALNALLDAMKNVAEQEKARLEAAAQEKAQAAQTQVKLLFGKASNIPEAVMGAFRKKLAKTPEVKSAYFCMMKQQEREFYLFTLDIDADADRSREIGDSLCESAKMFLTKFPIMAAPLNSPFGEGAKKVGEPFYTKE